MKVSILAIPLFIFFTKSAMGQIEVGYYHDLDGLPIHGYVDTYQYSPTNMVRITEYVSVFENGKVYFANGSVAEGLIKYDEKKIWYKKTDFDTKTKLKPDDVIGLTMGLDSFFVSTNFNVERKVGPEAKTKPQFMQYLTSFGGKVYAKHYLFTSAMAQQYTVAAPIIETFLVRELGTNYWISFPRRKKEFERVALEQFGHIPHLRSKIEDGSLGFEDINTLIKTAEYMHKFEQNETIHFDQYWNEIRDKTKSSSYQGKILSFDNDSIWTIEYSEKSKKIYQAQYYSLFPHKKDGEFIIYGEEGAMISKTNYQENEIVERHIYNEKGKVDMVYSFEKIEPDYGKEYTSVEYQTVLNDEGSEMKKAGAWQTTSTFKQGTFTNKFDGGVLQESYRELDGKRIYQVMDTEYNFKVKKLQSSVKYVFDEADFSKAVEANSQGILFLSVIVSDKGKVLKQKLLNEIHPQLSSALANWSYNNLKTLKFKPYKVNDQKVNFEFLIPVQFSIQRFYRQPTYFYYDPFMFDPFLNQQWMMQQMPIPTPPPRPPGF